MGKKSGRRWPSGCRIVLICPKNSPLVLQFFDTHAHLDDALKKGTLQTQMDYAHTLLVQQVAVPNCDLASLPDVVAACAAFPGRLYPMCGLHPTHIHDDVEEQLAALQAALAQPGHPFVAVGEVGIDLYWRKDNLPAQQAVLHRQMAWAEVYGLPVALHSRDALQETLEVVSDYKGRVRGVFHCFSGTVEEAKQVLDLGYFLGIGGNVTYKSNQTLATLQTIGLEGVVLETDSPYLAPVPYRCKPNQPAYTRYVADFLAAGLQVPLEEVARITTRNAHALFNLTA